MYYNPEIVKDEKCLELVYKLLNRNDASATLPDTDRIRNMVKRQAALFPGSSKFDYRTLFEEGKESNLDKYFDKELMDTVVTLLHVKRTFYCRQEHTLYRVHKITTGNTIKLH